MPMYDYRCKHCGEKFEELVFSSSVSDEEIQCPNCGEHQAERLLSAPAVSVGGSVGTLSTSGSSCSSGSGFT